MQPRIFVIDKTSLSLQVTLDILEARGYREVYGFYSPAEALKALRAGVAATLVIADLDLPHLDGISLLNAIRRINPATKGIILTAEPDSARQMCNGYAVVDKESLRLPMVLGDAVRSSMSVV
jgi:CheY-like chemotaxis protein